MKIWIYAHIVEHFTFDLHQLQTLSCVSIGYKKHVDLNIAFVMVQDVQLLCVMG
jgi:hypothetical protein